MTGPRSEREVAQAMHAVAEAPPGLEAHREGRRRGLGFFEAILPQASLPIAVLRDGLPLFTNPRYALLLDAPPEALAGMPFVARLAPEHQEAVRTLLEAPPAEGATFTAALQGREAQLWRIFPFQQGGTGYVGLLGLEATCGPSPLGDRLLESEHLAALRLQAGSQVSGASSVAARLLGRSREELRGRCWADVAAEEDLPELLRAHGRAARGEHAEARVRLRQGDGTLLPLTLELVPDGEGGVLALLEGRMPPPTEEPGSELCYRQLFQAMPEAYALHEVVLDASGHPVDYRILEVNAAWEALMGHSAAEVRGHTAREIFPGIETGWIARLGEVALTGRSARFEHYSGSQGRFFRILAQCPHPGFFTMLAHDITEERRKESRLALLSTAIAQSPVSVLITDASGAIEYVNPAFTQVTGYGTEEVLGHNPRLLKSPTQDPATHRELWRTLSTGQTWRGELRNRRKDGTEFHERAVISPILQHGQVTHYLAVKEDITRERHLERIRQRLFEALEQTDDGVLMLDAAGAPVLANRAAHRLLGCGEHASADPATLPQDCRIRAFLEGPGKVLAGLPANECPEHAWRGHIPCTGPEGRPRTLSAVARLSAGDGPGGHDLLCVLHDVTEELQRERYLRQAEKMDALGKLASGVAHDFNNILTAILAAAELLEWQIPEMDPGRGKIEAIRLASRRAQELNRRILAFARSGEERRVPFDLSAVVREVVAMLRETAPPGITLETRLSSSIWCTGDPNQILQVALNLAVNAFHAMRAEGGTLELTLAEEALEAESGPGHLPEGRYAVMSLRDTGCGMAPELLDQVFEPFFTTKPQGEGTGMGLFVVHGIVTAHGGDIRLASAPGQGTTATVLLPCTDPVAEPGQAIPREEPVGQEQVLLAGGDELGSALIAQGLRMLGYRVTAKLDPFEALEQLRAHTADFDALLVDPSLQGMSAQALVRRTLRLRPGLPVVLLAEPSQDLPLLAEGGPDDQVLLPATPRDIAHVLRRAFAARAQAAPEEAKASEIGPPRHRILLAEDSAVTRSLLGSWLAKAGYGVTSARDGQEAWELFESEEDPGFDAVLTDLVMPRLDGLQLLERLRERDATLPIVILSSVEDAEQVKAAVHLRATEYLNKPFTSGTLVGCVRSVLDASRSRGSARRSEETARAVRMAQRALVAVPERDLPVYTLSEPFTDAGGDVLRCTRMADGSIFFVLADVAGHSVICSYAVASFLGMLSSFTPETRSLAELAARLNRTVQDGPFSEIPVCALMGIWQPDTGRVHLLNSGIPYGLHLRRRRGDALPIVLNGTPLGIFPEAMVEERVLWLEEGDRLFFATDGLFELRDGGGRSFQDLAPSHWGALAGEPVGTALESLCRAAQAFGGGHLEDDLLAIAFEQPATTQEDVLALWIPSEASALDDAVARFSRFLQEGTRLGSTRRFELALALREALTNALLHGNRGREGAGIHLRARLREEGRRLDLRVTDEGSGFDLDHHRAPDDPLSERGRGIPCMRAAGASLRMDAGELRMRFELEDGPCPP